LSHSIALLKYFTTIKFQSTMKKFLFVFFILMGLQQVIFAQSFSSSGLSGESLNNPTSLQFGPDDRLYVSQQDGTIQVYTIVRNSPNDYDVTNTETINLVKNIPNHNDDGTLHTDQIKRQVTGILVKGTANSPILYVTSSDYRIGGGGSGADKNLDTNSGMISKLTQNGNGWTKVDLVRGLPRSEENHATNGIQIDDATNTMYVAQGGHTNAGSPSNNFAFNTEYALSAAVLTVDLDAIEAMPNKTDSQSGQTYKYNLPTVNDPTRPNSNGQDVNDPFGGNDGLNQAIIVPGGPVQVYSPGFRNIYDVVLTESGKLYTWDNGANAGWGGHPENEGGGSATNNWVSGEPGSTGPGPNDAKVNNKDGLHYITGQGYYGGHPNPIRANPSGAGLFTNNQAGGENGIWRTNINGNSATTLPVDWPPLPLSVANPIEGDFQNAGVDDASLYTVSASTNGMTEYTASNFNNSLKGNLLAASFNENIYNVNLNNAGSINSAQDVSVFASNFGANPLDVTAQGDNDIFPGTVWAATYGANNVTIFEPSDYDGTTPPASDGIYINCGGPTVTLSGITWEADNYFANGSTYSNGNSISGTSNDALYQTERWNANLAYNIPVQNGTMEVELHFADIYNGTHSVGARVFDVFIEDNLVLDNLDIFDEVDAYTALVKTFTVTVTDGTLNITMQSVANNAKLSGIALKFEQTQNCTGAYSNSIDEDNDGFSNADEIDNNADPCNGAIQPPDFDGTLIGGFLVSNLNDPDDDDDGILDNTDKFAWDANNGLGNTLPIDYPFLNGDPGFGFYGLGFTGLMTNNNTDYLDLIKDENNSNTEIIAGGAVGLFTINNVSKGDATGSTNSQHNAYQFGIDVNSITKPFTIESAILGPVFTSTPDGSQSQGVYIGNGQQNNYLKVVVAANNGNPVIEIGWETLGNYSSQKIPVADIGNVAELSLFLKVNPETGIVQAQYSLAGGQAINVGAPVTLTDYTLSALQSSSQSLAVGLISTTVSSDPDFSATWDYIKINTETITGNAEGLGATYYNNINFTGSTVTRVDPTIDFTWGQGSPDPAIDANTFSARWEGFVLAPTSGTYTFFTNTDDGVRLWIDNEQLIDQWVNQGPTEVEGTIQMTAGQQVPITMEYYENGGGAVAQLLWQGPGVAKQIIPSDYLFPADITPPTSIGNWVYINDGASCSAFGNVGSCSDGRHEASYVEVGDKFVLLGGRENNSRVNIYDPITDIWTLGATPPINLHHFQAVEYHGMILVLGAMTGNCCNEPGIDKIYIYDPVADEWHDGPDVPNNRQRGGAGCVVYNGDIYLLSGTTTGHSASGWVAWFDKYDPETDTWTQLPDAPRARDHFHAAVIDNKLYAAAGRRSGANGIFNGTISEVDVFNFQTRNWQTLPNDIPTERAGNTVAVLGNELIVIGGEREAGAAKSETEALNVNTNNWRDLADLNTGRHGSQAIVNNDNIWIATGSPNRGGGQTPSQERFYFDTPNTPILTSVNKSNLSGTSSQTIDGTEIITFTNTSGNQAILIESVQISGNFQYNTYTNLPFILKPGATYDVEVSYTGNGGQSGTLSISHTGNNNTNIALSGGTPSVSEEYWLEAECAAVGSTFTIITDNNASESEAVNAGSKSTANPPSDIAANRIRFTVNAAQGTYKIYTRALAPNTASNSHWVRVNNGNWVRFNQTADSNYKWAQVSEWLGGNDLIPVNFNFADGINTIDFAYREPNIKLDKIYITKTGTPPGGTGDTASNCANNKLEETSEPYLILYPNPANQQINLALHDLELSPEQQLTVTMYSLNGKKIYENHINASNLLHIDITHLPPNQVYFLRLQTDDGRMVRAKFLKL